VGSVERNRDSVFMTPWDDFESEVHLLSLICGGLTGPLTAVSGIYQIESCELHSATAVHCILRCNALRVEEPKRQHILICSMNQMLVDVKISRTAWSKLSAIRRCPFAASFSAAPSSDPPAFLEECLHIFLKQKCFFHCCWPGLRRFSSFVAAIWTLRSQA
jgi:hypothetical protein